MKNEFAKIIGSDSRIECTHSEECSCKLSDNFRKVRMLDHEYSKFYSTVASELEMEESGRAFLFCDSSGDDLDFLTEGFGMEIR